MLVSHTRGMTTGEKEIVDLYITSGLSEQQISRRLHIEPSRVRWVIKKSGVPKRSVSEAVRLWHITKNKKREFVLNTRLTSKQRALKLAAVMLYWGEGTKRGSTVALTNSDPAMIALFAKFLREVCGIDRARLRVGLHLNPDHDVEQATKFWANVVGISVNQLHKPFVHAKTMGRYKKQSRYGTVALIYSDKRLLGLMNEWIECYKQQFAGVAQG